jgi:hypothetical protein
MIQQVKVENSPTREMSLTRRQFLRRALWSLTGLAVTGTGYTTLIEPRRPEITRHTLHLPRWPRALDGLTLTHITDLHRSTIVSRDYLHDCLARVNALTPDLVVATGDYLTHGRTPRGRLIYGDHNDGRQLITDVAQGLAPLRAPHGVFASLGNHDHWYNAALVTQTLQNAGIPVLRNANTILKIRGAELPIVGLGDLWTEGVDFPRAFAGVGDRPALVLMHNPDTFETWSRPGTHLILAGHTHGGQVNLPFLGAPVVPSRYGPKYAQGLFQRDTTTMYVNRGLGLIWPAVRFNCRPEIAHFTLHCA